MKSIVDTIVYMLAILGLVAAAKFGNDMFTSKNAVLVKKPYGYVHRGGLDKAQLLCENEGGILTIGGMYIKDGVSYELTCMYGEKFKFESKH